MRIYKQGLKPLVRRELIRTRTLINNLEELIIEAIRLDNELYELALEERLFTKRTRKLRSLNN
jgi:cell division protein FtsL